MYGGAGCREISGCLSRLKRQARVYQVFNIPFIGEGDSTTPFPRPENALQEPNGLVAAGGDLSPERLLMAYQAGIFPWFSQGDPILWWSPDPRCVIFPENFTPNRSLRKVLKRGLFEIRKNTAFEQVIHACALPRKHESGTWITDSMKKAYNQMHTLGHAHSIEAWQDNQLVGGLYGIAIGKVFFGESMFSQVDNASKVALTALTLSSQYQLIDCQMQSAHLLNMGAALIPRTQFQSLLDTLIR